MKLEGTGLLVRIYLGESDHWHGKPLYQAIVERLRAFSHAACPSLCGALTLHQSCAATQASLDTAKITNPR